MKVFPSDEEIDQVAELLVERYRVSSQLLGQLFGPKQKKQANGILQKVGERSLGREDLAKLIIMHRGSHLLCESKDTYVRKLRQVLLSRLPKGEIQALYETYGPGNRAIYDPARMIRPLVGKKWRPGGP